MPDRYLRSLLIRSGQIQQTIERECRAPRPDGMRLLHLKKVRLAISERMQRILVERVREQQLQNVCAGRPPTFRLNPPPNPGEQLWR
jgi:hypothetical protein